MHPVSIGEVGLQITQAHRPTGTHVCVCVCTHTEVHGCVCPPAPCRDVKSRVLPLCPPERGSPLQSSNVQEKLITSCTLTESPSHAIKLVVPTESRLPGSAMGRPPFTSACISLNPLSHPIPSQNHATILFAPFLVQI